MVTYYWVTVELRFSGAPPAEIFGYLSPYYDRVDPLLYHGNLVVRYDKRWNFERTIKPVLTDLCETYDGIHRAAQLRFNDTGDSTSITLYWHRDGDLTIEETVDRAGYDDPVTDWHVPDPHFEGGDWRRGQVLDRFSEPVRYLKHRYGFYTLHDLEATYRNDAYETCPTLPADELLAFDVASRGDAYAVAETLRPIRCYPDDTLLVDGTALVRVDGAASKETIESAVADLLAERYTGERAYRYRTGPIDRDMTAIAYESESRNGAVAVDTLETPELGVVDHRYRPYTYRRDPAEYFSEHAFAGVAFDDCYGYPTGGRFEQDTLRLD